MNHSYLLKNKGGFNLNTSGFKNYGGRSLHEKSQGNPIIFTSL